MKFYTTKLTRFTALAMFLITVSCSVEDGVDGAMGHPWEQGIQGQQGEQGSPGDQGM